MKHVAHLITAVGFLICGMVTAESASAIVNEFCPVMPDEKIDLAVFTDYKDQRIYFCCKRCKKMFLENPGEYSNNLPKLASNAQSESTDDHDAAHAHKTDAVVHEAPDRQPEQVHDHGEDHGGPHGIGRAIRFIGKFHPLIVHFPIALVLTAALAEILFMLKGRPIYSEFAHFSILLGALTAVVAVALGLAAGSFVQYPGKLGNVMTIHQWLGISTASISMLAVTFSLLYRRKYSELFFLRSYRIALAASAVLIGATGHFGALLIYGVEHFSW